MYRIIGLILLISTSLLAGSIHYSWNSSAEDVQLDSFEEWVVISIDGGMPAFGNGYPNLPAVPRCYVIPQGTTVTGVEVTNITSISLGRSLLPSPVMFLPLSGDVPEFPNYTERSLEGMSNLFPSSSIVGFKTGTKTGFRIGSYSFTPFTYNKNTGEITLITSADITVEYEFDPDAPCYTLSSSQLTLAREGLKLIVDNPDMLASWAPSERSDLDEDIEVLIVGYSQQSSQLEDLVALHNTLGYKSDFATVQWIQANIEGYDIQERIRNHLKDLYENEGLLYVVMCGDVGATTRVSGLADPYLMGDITDAVDLYFSDLDGLWDSDGDHSYGERYDGVDYYSDVYVGRYPSAITETDLLSAMIEKTLLYNTEPMPGDWRHRSLLLGAILYPEFFPDGNWCHGSKYCDSVATFFPTNFEWDTVYEDTSGSHADNQLELFNQGRSFVSYTAHGDRDGFYWYYPLSPPYPPETMLHTDSIEKMDNGQMLPLVYGSVACYTGDLGKTTFSYEGFAESLVQHPEGGAICAIAANSYGVGGVYDPGPSGWPSIYFAQLLFEDEITTIGYTHGLAKDMFWSQWHGDLGPRKPEWIMQGLNLYGDPCIVFVTALEGVESGVPQQLNSQISPNPVWHTMSVNVTLAQPAPLKVIVYDILGRVALSRDEEIVGAGEQSFSMDVSSLSTGIYLVSVSTGDLVHTTKCIVL